MKKNTVAFDIVHPAQLLFYYWIILRLKKMGVTVDLYLRKKDILVSLAEELDLPYKTISKAGSGLVGLGSELVVRDFRLFLNCLRRRPNLLVGFGAVAASHVGFVLRIPSLAYYDDNDAHLQNLISYPFLNRLVVPESYDGNVPEHKTRRFKGTKECSYLDPKYFIANPDLLAPFGFDTSKKVVLIRLVEWRANHDLGLSGLNDDDVRALIDNLPPEHQVILSSERALSPDLEELSWRGTPATFHHLIASANLVIGESSTVVQEAAMLGTQAVYISPLKPDVTRHLAELGLFEILGLDDLTREKLSDLLGQSPSKFPEEWFRLHDQIMGDILQLAKMEQIGSTN